MSHDYVNDEAFDEEQDEVDRITREILNDESEFAEPIDLEADDIPFDFTPEAERGDEEVGVAEQKQGPPEAEPRGPEEDERPRGPPEGDSERQAKTASEELEGGCHGRRGHSFKW